MTEPEPLEPAAPPRRKGCCLGRLLAAMFLVMLLVIALAAAALYLGGPQRAALRYAANNAGMDAEIGAIRMTPGRFELASLRLDRQDEAREHPAVLLEGLRVEFGFFNPDTPPVTAVTIASFGLWLEEDDFDAVERPERPARVPTDPAEPAPDSAEFADILRYLPNTVHIAHIEGGYTQADLAFAGGPVSVEMTNPGDGSLRFAIAGTPSLEAAHEGERFESEDAELNLLVDWTPDRVTVTAKAALPPWLDLDADTRFTRGDTGWEGLIDIAAAQVDDLPAPLKALMPVNSDFRRIMVAPSRIVFAPTENGFTLGESTLAASATGLRLGPEDAPWFQGDPALDISGEGERFQGRLTHDDARSIDFDGRIGAEPAINVSLSGWTYPDLEALTPVDYLEVTALFSSLHHLDARVHIASSGGRLSFSGVLDPAFGLDPAWHDQLRLDAAFSIPMDDEAGGFEGLATLQLAGNAMVLDAANIPGGGITIDAMMHAFDLPRLAQLLALAPPEVRELDSLFSGTAHALFDETHTAMNFSLDASPPPFLPFESLYGNTVAIEASLTAPSDFAGLSGTANFSLDPHAAIDAGSLRANLETQDWSTTLSGAVDLGAAAAYLDLGPLAGDLTFDAPVRGSRDAIETDFSITIDGPAYDGMGLGYGDLLAFTGTARYPYEGEGSIRDLVVTAGEGTRLTAPEAAFTPSPLAFHAPEAVFVSDGIALIGAGYLDAMRGTIDATGSIEYGPEDYHLAMDYSTEYDLLTLRNALAVISGGTGEGRLEWTPDGLDGEGVLTAQDLAVFGVTLERVHVPLAFEGTGMRLNEFEAGLFNGRVLTNGRVGLLEDGMPAEFTARLRSVDLAPFSDAFLSPETRVTGTANGTVRVRTDNLQVTGFEASLRSVRDFSIHRDFLAQLIMQEQVGEAAGRAVSGVLAEVLGEARQRPFDGADIELALEDDLIRGTAELRSQTLNLTVNLTMDPRHVGELMRLNQREEMERLRSR